MEREEAKAIYEFAARRGIEVSDEIEALATSGSKQGPISELRSRKQTLQQKLVARIFSGHTQRKA